MNTERSGKLRIWLPAIQVGSGADVFALRLANALQGAGHEPLLQWFDHRYELMPWCLKRVMAPPGIDLVHAGSWQGFAFKRAGIPLVITEHQYVAHPAFAPYRSLPQALYHRHFVERCAKRSYAEAAAIVAVSEHCAIAMRDNLTKPVSVIHNWIDTELFSPLGDPDADAHDPGQPTRPFKLLFVGNPSRWKGADLLTVIADLLGPRFEIHCLGGLRKDFDLGNLPQNMKLLPRMLPDQMPAVYRSVDAALVLTRYEAFGYVALEAMACGLPVLGFNSTGTAEVCIHEETALLAPVDDVHQLATYARQMACDNNLSRWLGDAGRRRAVECFGEKRAVDAYMDIYHNVAMK